jgi:hypothetical protein
MDELPGRDVLSARCHFLVSKPSMIWGDYPAVGAPSRIHELGETVDSGSVIPLVGFDG